MKNGKKRLVALLLSIITVVLLGTSIYALAPSKEEMNPSGLRHNHQLTDWSYDECHKGVYTSHYFIKTRSCTVTNCNYS